MSPFLTLLGLWLYWNHAAPVVLAQENRTTITTSTTPGISVYAFAPNSSIMTTLPVNSTSLIFAATSTIAMQDVQPDVAQDPALDASAPTLSTNNPWPRPITTGPPYPSTTTNSEWLVPVSMALLCYDFLAATAFIWCWVMGYLWWWRRTSRSAEVQARRARREESSILGVLMDGHLEGEMRRLGMV